MKFRTAVILTVALHSIVLVVLYLSGPADVIGDGERYWRLGTFCASGDFLWQEDLNAYRTPGYPIFLGVIQRLCGDKSWRVVIAAQHLLLIATAWVSCMSVKSLVNNKYWGLIAYLLSALGLIRTWFAQTILTETLFTFVVSLHFLALIRCMKHVTLWRCVLVGASLGIAILVRPVLQYWWIIAFGLIIFVGSEAEFQQRVRGSLVGGLAIVVFVAPWFIRNQTLFGEPFLTEFVGRNLWIVTFQDGSGANLDFPDTEAGNELLQKTGWSSNHPNLRATWSVSDRLVASGMPDDDADRLMLRVSLDALKTDLDTFAFKTLRRCVNFWRCVPNQYPYIDAAGEAAPQGQANWGHSGIAELETRLYLYVPQQSLRWNELVAVCVALGLLVMILHSDLRWYGVAILLFLAMMTVVTSLLEVPNVRYRMVLEPLMVTAICCAGSRLLKFQSQSKQRST